MIIKYFCPRWGSEDLPFEAFLKKVEDADYDGVEMSLPLEKEEREFLLKSTKDRDLLFVAQHWETASIDFEVHKKEYRKRIENLASANPVLINSQTGKDFFTFEQNAELIAMAYEIAEKHGVKLVHETHRGKFSFAAHVTARFIRELPELRLGLDISHWCAVAESFLENQQENVELAISRTDHIHARVGYPCGPQIPDPRVPEWQEAVDIHLGWWQKIIDRNKKEGKEFFSITSEFGPYPYMTHLPFTQQAIASQWDINVYMMHLLREKLA